MVRHWAFAVFLLTIPIAVEPRTATTLSSRQRRSVSHAQMMHDRSRSLQERKRRLWIQALLQQVHTGQMWDSPIVSDGRFQIMPWSIAHRPKYPSSTKTFLPSFQLETVRTRDNLPQETSKTLRYDQQPLKTVMKRKRRICSERWRDPDRRRDWGCDIQTQLPIRTQQD